MARHKSYTSSLCNEPCAAVANALWQQRLFLLHRDAKYVDVLERVLYNGMLGGVTVIRSRNPAAMPFTAIPYYAWANRTEGEMSVWVDYLRGAATPQTEWVHSQIAVQRLGLLDLIFCEVLQGVSGEREFEEVRDSLLALEVFFDRRNWFVSRDGK